MKSTPSSQDFHVSVSGDDSNAGTESSPLRSISEASKRAMPGDTIWIHPGIYRERVDPPRGGTSDTCRITYQAVEIGTVDLRGSEVVKGWQHEKGTVWSVQVPNSVFGEFNPFGTLLRGHWFVDKGRKHHRGAVYCDGHWLAEAASDEELGSFHDGDPLWYAEVLDETTRIRAEFHDVNPNEACVEVNVRPTVFYPSQAGCDFISVVGLILQHGATPWSPPTTEQVGLLGTNWSKGWMIRDNIIRYSIAAGITLGKYHDPEDHPELDTVEGTSGEDTYHGTIRRALEQGWTIDGVGNHTVTNNRISHCEMAGICGSLGAVRCRIEGNTIHDIHVRRLFFGFEQAGIKFHAPIDSTIRANRIFRCFRGMWLDWMTQGTRVTGNLFYENGSEHDLFIEVSHGPFLVDHNVFLSPHALSSWSQGGVYAHNFFLGRVDARAELGRITPFHHAHSTAIKGWRSVNLGNDLFLNNVFCEPKGLQDYDQATEPVRMEGNVYLGESSPGLHDARFEKTDAFPISELIYETRGEEVYLCSPRGWCHQADGLIDSHQFENHSITGLSYDAPDGSSYLLDQDFFGNSRQVGNSSAGPFAQGFHGGQDLKIWPVGGSSN